MKLDVTRTLRAVVLAAWAAFFTWLLISGQVFRYIGPRTQWVVFFGAIALTLAAVAHLAGLRSSRRTKPTPADLLGFLALLLPLIAVLAVPSPSLGSLAASKKLTPTSFIGGAVRPQPSGGEVSFAEIEYASGSAEYAAALGIVDGFPVRLTGFVTHPEGLPDGHFALTRFSIFCCAADVVPHSVTVDGSGLSDYAADQWLTVGGVLENRAGEFVVVPEEVTEVEEPKNPYIR